MLIAHSLRVAIDVILLALAFGLAFALRFDWSVPPDMLARMFLITPYVVVLQYATLAFYGAPRVSWRFFSLRDLKPFGLAFATSSMVLIFVRMVVPSVFEGEAFASHLLVPVTVVVLDAGMALAFTAAARVLRRAVSEDVEAHGRKARSVPPKRYMNTLLIGAGRGGVSTAQELGRRPDLGIVPVGFVDDDPAKLGMRICGIPVLGRSADLKSIVSRSGADEALITVANARGPAIRRLTALCEDAGLPVRIVPGIHEIVGGTVNLSAIREVAIDDLLGRAPIRLDESSVKRALQAGHVLVTGAGGSIGSELCRQIARFKPHMLILVDSSENNLFNIHRELVGSLEGIELVPLVASVTDRVRMREIFARYRPEVILHAAAYKHVPMMELNPAQAALNNALGTRTVADLADEFEAREFVLVSTDKAVRPSSVMGATKRAAEIYVQALSGRSATRFITVRFGNVLGSAGSVVPIFKEQIARGGPVTITDPRMTRYFMTIPEACQLILQAAQLGRGGEIFMLDMGEPVKILDLARDLISLSGFTPEVDIEIVVSGIRPGEKLTEELWSRAEDILSTPHPSIFVGTSPAKPFEEVRAWYDELEKMRLEATSDWARPFLCRLVPEAQLLSPSVPPSPEVEEVVSSIPAFAMPSTAS
ncbi:MAG: polysaccharide biosynthesis protein CapD [Myxococcaceae bacterium]|nr:polysaccharide biosynthesis protein CapD [Myxococcaceae bacterium]